MTVDSANHDGREAAGGWLRRHIVSLAGLTFALVVMLGVVYYYTRNPGVFHELRNYGYFGAFVISLILNATIILPVSNLAIMMTLGATLPQPALVGILGALGAAIGELTGYTAGRSGRGLLARNNIYLRVEGWTRRWGWIAVFFLSVFPFLFDIVGITAGALRMPLWRFLLACFLGRAILYVAAVILASMGLRAVPWFH